tara:strand:+ start:187 stop:462 length:276 start_codon:yes stop_codon:yes gene_type:complete
MFLFLRDISDSLLNQINHLLKKKSTDSAMDQLFLSRIEMCLACSDLKEKKVKALSNEKTIKFCNHCKCIFPYFVFAHRKKCPIDKWNTTLK